MAENGKTKIIITIIIGLFGVMCFGFALTVTDKYKTTREKYVELEKKYEAGKNELIKIPEMQDKTIKAVEQAKYAQEELASAQEELEELEEELDEVTEELEALKAESEEEADSEAIEDEGEEVASGSSEREEELLARENELITQLETANDEIEKLRTDLESSKQEVEKIKSTGISSSSEVSLCSSTGGGGSVGFTFEGMYNVDPEKEKQEQNREELHRGLDYKHKRTSETIATTSTESAPSDKSDAKNQIKNEIDTINAKVSELLAYAGESISRNQRIGIHSYEAGPSGQSAKTEKISKTLNDVFESYSCIFKVISESQLYTPLKRGLAKSALDKRIASYISQLASLNQSGEFSGHDKDVKMLLTRIQKEQKYFLN